MDQETFARGVRDALEHLHSRAYLATLPLAKALADDKHPVTGEALRHELLTAIEQLRPDGASTNSADFRRYRNLTLRYVEGQSREQVADTLGISLRQATRDHQQAVEMMVGYLWRQRVAGGRTSSMQLASADPMAVSTKLGDPVQETVTVTAGDDNLADPGTMIDGVLATLDALNEEHGVTFTTAGIDTLPPVAMSPTLLRHAVLNLLSYTAKLAPGAELLVAGTDTARGVILRVKRRAHGRVAGVDPEPTDLSPVAQELLAAGRQILESEGGAVEQDPTSVDTLVTLVLPPAALHKVLVVDDNVDIVSLFRRYLHGQPYRLLQATSGTSALRLAQELRPDAIVLDVVLPSKDGWEVLGELRHHPETRGIPVIACSILPERALALSLGVADFLAKPVSRAALLAALERYCPPRGEHQARP